MLIQTSGPHNCDQLAGVLGRIANTARSMPPSWDGARIAVPVAGPDGQYVGKALPGKGLYLAFDRSRIGMTKLPAHVFEPTPIQRLVDKFREWQPRLFQHSGKVYYDKRTQQIVDAERGAITTYDSILTARGAGTGAPLDATFTKVTDTSVANTWHSLFLVAGMPPAGAYSALGAGTAPDKSTTGAYSFGLANPTNPNKKYLLTFGFASTSQLNIAVLFDLLSQCGGILMANAANAVNSAALTRYTTGEGVMAIFEVTTALGATAGSLQLASYTNQAGTAARANTTQACVNSAIVHRLVAGVGSTSSVAGGVSCNLQGNDYGVRAVTTATSSGNTGGGVVALNLYFPLAFIPGVSANSYMERDSTVQIDGLTELAVTSGVVLGCLGMYVMPSGTSTGQVIGFIRTCEG